jgi:hypothetical protein
VDRRCAQRPSRASPIAADVARDQAFRTAHPRALPRRGTLKHPLRSSRLPPAAAPRSSPVAAADVRAALATKTRPATPATAIRNDGAGSNATLLARLTTANGDVVTQIELVTGELAAVRHWRNHWRAGPRRGIGSEPRQRVRAGSQPERSTGCSGRSRNKVTAAVRLCTPSLA